MSNQHHPKHRQQQQYQPAASMIEGTTTSTSTPAMRPTLRRATYVHVSDLTSAYNIDHAKLEQELSRVNTERKSREASLVGGGRLGTTSRANTVNNFTVSSEQQHPSSLTAKAEAAAVVEDLENELTAPVSAQKRLQPPRGGFNLCVLVGAVTIVVDKRRVDQSRVRLAEVEIGDETGTVSLRARGFQIDMLEEISARGGAAVLRNATIELYQGMHIRLAVTKWGKLSPYPDNIASTPPPPSKMNLERNFSLIDLSIVATEMVEDPPLDVPTYASSRTPKVMVEPLDVGKCSVSAHSSSRSSGKKLTVSQPQGKIQSQNTPRTNSGKSNPDRRQARVKGSAAARPSSTQYGSVQAEARPAEQPQHVMYHSMPGYSSYEQAMDIQRYQYAHHSSAQNPDVMSTHQLLLQQQQQQQQFEMQQRQIHQLYSHQQQNDSRRRQHRADPHTQHIMHQQQAHAALIGGVGSFDTASYQGEPSEQHQPLHFTHLSSPLMIPMGIPGTGSMGSTSPNEQYSSPIIEGMSREMLSRRSSGTVSPFPVGRMNPDASSFAPSYASVTQGSMTGAQQVHVSLPHIPYDLQHSPHRGPIPNFYQSQPVQLAFYSPPEMTYPPRAPAPFPAQRDYEDSDQRSRRKPSSSAAQPTASDTSPQLSGKENVTSSP